jgi:hypothetical protein
MGRRPPAVHLRRWETPSVKQPPSMEAPPSSLSSRAKPRDLRFRGPFLEVFFDGAKPRDLQFSQPASNAEGAPATAVDGNTFVIPTEVERPANLSI